VKLAGLCALALRLRALAAPLDTQGQICLVFRDGVWFAGFDPERVAEKHGQEAGAGPTPEDAVRALVAAQVGEARRRHAALIGRLTEIDKLQREIAAVLSASDAEEDIRERGGTE